MKRLPLWLFVILGTLVIRAQAAPPAPASPLPRVLLIGEGGSIATDYFDTVQARLRDRAKVDTLFASREESPVEFLYHVNGALASQADYAVIHFSVGLDRRATNTPGAAGSFAHTVEKLAEIVHLRAPRAKLVWGNLTPAMVPAQTGTIDGRLDPVVVEGNRLAAAAMTKAGVEIDDLYRAACAHLELVPNGGSRWSPEGCDLMGTAVAAAIEDQLPLPADALALYIAPDGRDTSDGSEAAPFATLERARAAVRTILREPHRVVPAGGVNVILRGGVYVRDQPFTLGKEDSLGPEIPVTWRSAPHETARLVGGRRLSPGWFRPVTQASPVWPRLARAAQGNVLEVDLRAHGITDYGQLVPRGMHHPDHGALELFVDGEPLPLAQWPDAQAAPLQGMDTGFSRIEKVITPAELTIPDADLARWAHADQMWLHGYWGNFWSDFHLRAAAIDPAKKTVTLAEAPRYAMKAGMPFRVYNLLEEITTPGEWFLDRTTGKLYVWPTANWSRSEIFVSTLAGELVTLKDTAGIVLDGLVLEQSWSGLLAIEGGAHNTIRRCVLRNAGTDAVTISGSDNGLTGCVVENTGECGVRLSGGDRASLAPAGNYVRDSRISHFSRWTRTYTPGIELQGVGQIVANNLICDAPHAAILFFGNDHRIEFNDIHDVCRFSCDAGAIYAGRRWDFRGTVIRYNFIHRLHSPLEEPDLGENAVYLDDCISGTTVTGNIMYDITGDGILCNGGRDNVMTGNLLVRCGTALEITAFAVEHATDKAGSSWNLLEKLREDGVQYQSGPWARAYPPLAAIPPDWTALRAPGARWLYPEHDTFAGNIVWQTGRFLQRRYIGEPAIFAAVFTPRNNLEHDDPRFRDAARADFTLPPDSPAFALPDFAPIPFAAIGPANHSLSASSPRPSAP